MQQKYPTQECQGIKFYRKPNGYYKACFIKHGRRTIYMHRFVWECHNGPIPEGHHIHHINGDKSDNRIENLELLSGFEHLSHHAKNADPSRWVNALALARKASRAWHASEEGRLWHAEHAVRIWQQRQLRTYECVRCRKTYEALQGTAKRNGNGFCSNACKTAFRVASGVDNETRQCRICSAEFVCNKYCKKATCSKACATEAIRQTRRRVRPDSPP